MNTDKDTSNSSQDAQVEASRQRRRRINQAFRDGDLELCLREIKIEIEETQGESALLGALPKVQERYIEQIIESDISSRELAKAQRELDFVLSVGPTTDSVAGKAQEARARIEQARKAEKSTDVESGEGPKEASSIPEGDPEEERDKAWVEAHRVLKEAEKAWADDKKKVARKLVEQLDGFSIDDHDFILRKEGLTRLLDEANHAETPPGHHDTSAVRWVALLGIILAVAMIAIFLMDRSKSSSPLEEVERTIEEPARSEPALGWLQITGVDSSAVVRDESGDIVGSAMHLLGFPQGEQEIRVGAKGYVDTLLVLAIARAETLLVPVFLREEPPAQGWMSLRSHPSGATVTLENGERLGTTPLDRISFSPGSYRLRLTMEGRIPTTVQVAVRADAVDITDVELPLWHQTGKLQLNSSPWAYVFLNGDSLGPTPLTTGELKTDTTHELLFRAADGLELKKQVRLDPSRATPTPVTVEFPQPGILAVTTTDSLTGTPVWANIWTGSRRLGESPGEFKLAPGEFAIRIEKSGYDPREFTINISPGERVSLTLALMPHSS